MCVVVQCFTPSPSRSVHSQTPLLAAPHFLLNWVVLSIPDTARQPPHGVDFCRLEPCLHKGIQGDYGDQLSNKTPKGWKQLVGNMYLSKRPMQLWVSKSPPAERFVRTHGEVLSITAWLLRDGRGHQEPHPHLPQGPVFQQAELSAALEVTSAFPEMAQ